MRTIVFSVISLLLLASGANAQMTFSVGARAGYNVSTVRLIADPYHPRATCTYRSGFEAGLISSLGFRHFALQPTVLYAQKGYLVHGDQPTPDLGGVTYRKSIRFNYVVIPINLVYTQRTNGQGFQTFIGPYMGILLSGHKKTHYSYSGLLTPVEEGKVFAGHEAPNTTDEYVRRHNYGIQTGLGYRYGGLLFQASYSLGLRNIGVDYNFYGSHVPGPTYYNRAFQASLAYLFGSRS
jgi:hypothetical protein